MLPSMTSPLLGFLASAKRTFTLGDALGTPYTLSQSIPSPVVPLLGLASV